MKQINKIMSKQVTLDINISDTDLIKNIETLVNGMNIEHNSKLKYIEVTVDKSDPLSENKAILTVRPLVDEPGFLKRVKQYFLFLFYKINVTNLEIGTDVIIDIKETITITEKGRKYVEILEDIKELEKKHNVEIYFDIELNK